MATIYCENFLEIIFSGGISKIMEDRIGLLEESGCNVVQNGVKWG